VLIGVTYGNIIRAVPLAGTKGDGIIPSPPFFTFFQALFGSGLNLCFVGRISDSVIRQDHAILLGYAALTQPTNIPINNRFHPLPFISARFLNTAL